jgi:Putative prokaryotic signal transducing protein
MSETVCVRTFPNRIAAEAAEAVLRSAGIEALVRSDDAGGAAPHVGYTTGGARLMVRHGDLERAKQLLQDVQG